MKRKEVNSSQLDSVIQLSGDQRYRHFIKVVADWQQVWGLYDNGWALARPDVGREAFPVWPALEYAEICAQKEWDKYRAKMFSLNMLLNDLLPKLEEDKMSLAVFFTPSEKGVVVCSKKIRRDLEEELEKY